MPRSVDTSLVETDTTRDGERFFLADNWEVCRCECPHFHVLVWAKDRDGKPFTLITMDADGARNMVFVLAELLAVEGAAKTLPAA